MKRLFALLLLISCIATAQTKGTPEKIIFSYYKGHNSWKPGTYSRQEQLVYSRLPNGQYKLTSFLKIKSSARPKKLFYKTKEYKYSVDTNNINTAKTPLVTKSLIEDLQEQLNTNKKNFEINFIKPSLSIPTKKEIANAAKKIEEEYYFDKDFREEKQEIDDRIQSFYKLDTFLARYSVCTP